MIKADDIQNTNANTIFKRFSNRRPELEVQYDDFKETEGEDDDNKKTEKETRLQKYKSPRRDDDMLYEHLQEREVALENSNEDLYHDASSTILFLWKYKSKLSKQTTVKSEILYPEQVWQKLREFFIKQFDTNKNDKNLLERYIDKLMKSHEIHFVMTVPRGKDQFEIVAALILEQQIKFQEDGEALYRTYAIFHCIANIVGYHQPNFVDKLLDNVIYSRDLTERRLFFITRLGQFDYKKKRDDNIGLTKFLERKSIARTSYNFNMTKDGIIFDGSVTHFGHGRDVFWDLESNTSSTVRLRFFRMQNWNVFFSRWNDEEDKFQVYNHVIGWHDIPDKTNLQDMIPVCIQTTCKENPMKHYKLGGMSGSRAKSDESMLTEHDKKFPLGYDFKQEKYKEKYGMENNCAWLSIAALINSYDEESAKVMISKIDNEDEHSQYDWMFLVNMGKEHRDFGTNPGTKSIVNEKMKAKGIHWTLAKVKNHQYTPCGYKKFLLNRNTTGFYIATLGTEQGFAKHCVAIDCDKRLIYDCMENYVLYFDKRNLNYCLGSYETAVKCIPHCYEIQMKPISKKNLEEKNQRKRKIEDI